MPTPASVNYLWALSVSWLKIDMFGAPIALPTTGTLQNRFAKDVNNKKWIFDENFFVEQPRLLSRGYEKKKLEKKKKDFRQKLVRKKRKWGPQKLGVRKKKGCWGTEVTSFFFEFCFSILLLRRRQSLFFVVCCPWARQEVKRKQKMPPQKLGVRTKKGSAARSW